MSSSFPTIIWLLITLLYIVSFWKIFTKAGKPGWASLIPFYNIYVMLKMAKSPGWWLILYIIPLVNIIIAIIVTHRFSKAFGHGGGFTLGLLFLPFIFYPVLGFDGSRYQGQIMNG